MDTPIKLEDLCCVLIISDLEHYPVDILAKLSIPVRKKLLQNLPASDIIELENTCVADGISDFENEVWKKSYVCHYYKAEESQVSALGPRESFFRVIFTHLFSSVDTDYLCEMFFSVPKCLGIADLTPFTSVVYEDLDRLVPFRFAALFNRDFTSRYEIHAVVVISLNKAGFKPTKIHTQGGFAIELNSPYIDDLSILVSDVDTVELLVEKNVKTNLSVVKAVCKNGSPKLRSLKVYGDRFTQASISLLQEASIIGLETLHCTLPISTNDCKCLVEFLNCQTNMKELELYTENAEYETLESDHCERDQQLLSCIGNLINAARF